MREPCSPNLCHTEFDRITYVLENDCFPPLINWFLSVPFCRISFRHVYFWEGPGFLLVVMWIVPTGDYVLVESEYIFSIGRRCVWRACYCCLRDVLIRILSGRFLCLSGIIVGATMYHRSWGERFIQICVMGSDERQRIHGLFALSDGLMGVLVLLLFTWIIFVASRKRCCTCV